VNPFDPPEWLCPHDPGLVGTEQADIFLVVSKDLQIGHSGVESSLAGRIFSNVFPHD